MACSWGPSPSTRQVPGSSPGPGGRAARAFFSPPSLLREIVFFRTFPTQSAVRLGFNNTTGWPVYHNPNSIKSYKIVQKLSPKHTARGVAQLPYPILNTERLACLNNPMACSWGPSPSTRQVPGLSPGPGGRTAHAFFSTLPSFLLREIVFSHLPHPTCG